MDRSSGLSWVTLTPADLLHSIRRHIPSILVTAIAVSVAVAAILVVWPNRYASEGLMYVRLGRGAVSLDPTSQPSKAVSMQESRTAEVLSVREMLMSRTIAERVVDNVGVDEIMRPRTLIAKTLDSVSTSISSFLPASTKTAGDFTPQEYRAQVNREEAIKAVQDSVSVSVPKNAYTVSVWCSGDDPILAQQIVQSMMDAYGALHVDAHRASGSLEFFEQQVSESRRAATETRNLLQQAKIRLGWSSETFGESVLQERIAQLEISLDEAESSLKERESRAEAFNIRVANFEEWVPSEVTRGVSNNATDTMLSYLYTLQVQENDALSRLKPDHPKFRMLADSVNKSKKLVDQQEQEKVLEVEAINPVRQEIVRSYEVALAESVGLKSRVESLRQSLEEARADLSRLNQDSLELARLTWDANIAEQNFLTHSKSLEEARILDALDSSNMSDVSVIQDASLQLKKVGPPRVLLALMGCMLGLCLGLVQAIVRDTTGSVPRSQGLSNPHPRESAGVQRVASRSIGSSTSESADDATQKEYALHQAHD